MFKSCVKSLKTLSSYIGVITEVTQPCVMYMPDVRRQYNLSKGLQNAHNDINTLKNVTLPSSFRSLCGIVKGELAVLWFILENF